MSEEGVWRHRAKGGVVCVCVCVRMRMMQRVDTRSEVQRKQSDVRMIQRMVRRGCICRQLRLSTTGGVRCKLRGILAQRLELE